MAQTRAHKIGTIYSRVRNLLECNAMSEEAKPLWYEVYEACPPKYEPRYDRHLVPFGEGSNAAMMPDPKKIFFEEDRIRAKYYKAFMHEDSKSNPTIASTEVFDMISGGDIARRSLSQIFIEKYNELRDAGKLEEEELFLATVESLEIDGINLRDKPAVKEDRNEPKTAKTTLFPSLEEMMRSDDDNKDK